jgi:hypothetical protein
MLMMLMPLLLLLLNPVSLQPPPPRSQAIQRHCNSMAALACSNSVLSQKQTPCATSILTLFFAPLCSAVGQVRSFQTTPTLRGSAADHDDVGGHNGWLFGKNVSRPLPSRSLRLCLCLSPPSPICMASADGIDFLSGRFYSAGCKVGEGSMGDPVLRGGGLVPSHFVRRSHLQAQDEHQGMRRFSDFCVSLDIRQTRAAEQTDRRRNALW